MTDRNDRDPFLGELIDRLEDRPPAGDLWPGISRRITAPTRGVLQIRWPMAAASALVLLAGGAVLHSVMTPPPSIEMAPSGDSATPIASPEVLILPAGFDRAELTLAEAIDELERVYRAEAGQLDPDLRKVLGDALTSLDAAIADARARAGHHPDDVDAARYLTRTMQRKLDVLRTATSLRTHL
jgi:hypothetical protein